MKKKYALFYVTVPNQKLAIKIGESCLQNQLVACVNIVDKIMSLYNWNGKFCRDKEYILIMKGLYKNFPEIKNKVQELHEYTCPCILVLPVLDGSKTFLDWIDKSCI